MAGDWGVTAAQTMGDEGPDHPRPEPNSRAHPHPGRRPRLHAWLSPLRIAGLYIVAGAVWILVSDRVVDTVFAEPESQHLAQTIKGWSFIAVTGALLWLLVRRFAREVAAAAHESEERFRNLAERNVVGIWHVTQEGRTLYANPSMCAMLEVDGPEALERGTYHQFFTPASLEVMKVELAKRRAGMASSYEAEMVGRRGTRRRVIISGAPHVRPDGTRTLIGTFTDITERTRTEERLEQSEERYRFLFQRAPVLTVAIGEDGEVRDINEEVSRRLGWRREEVIGRNVGEFVLEEQREQVAKLLEADFRGEETPETEMVIFGRDGRRRTVFLAAGQALFDDEQGRRTALITGIDVTDRMLSEERFRMVASVATDAIYDWDLITDRLWWSEGMQTLFGFEQSEITPDLAWWSERVHPDDGQRVLDSLNAAVEEGAEDWSEEYRFRRSDGGYSDVIDRGRILRDETGRPVRMVGGMKDISERKTAERRQALMMAELDHRVKNNLAAVLSIAETSLAKSDSLEAFRRSFTGRIAALARVHALLAQGKWEGVSLRQLMERTLAAYSSGAKAEVSIEGEEHRIAPAAAPSLCMAFHELATNAAKYGALSNRQGRVSVRWVTAAGGNGRAEVRIEWVESGGPAVGKPERLGLGSEIIRGAIEYELGGKVAREFRAEGLRCDIVLPAASILAVEGGAARGRGATFLGANP